MLLLASQSPRRKELLSMLDLPFKTVEIKGVKEIYPEGMSALYVPEYLSKLKSSAYEDEISDGDILITADTVVIIGNEIIGKPRNPDEAKRMLHRLSGRKHKVATGVTIANKEKSVTFSTVTDVTFAPLSDRDINYYVEKYQPLDKAGAYGIQEWIGAIGVKSIEGSFYNVMGLPVQKLYEELLLFNNGRL